MKKVLTLILALTLVFALGVPALAANPTGGTTEGTSGTTALTYEVASKYSIIIPESIGLTAGTGDTARILSGSGDFKVIAGSLILANQTLKFAITAATNYADGFYLVNGSKSDVKISYTIADAASAGTAVAKDEFFLTATAAEAFDGKAQSLYLTSVAYTQAGTYTDMLTITVSLV